MRLRVLTSVSPALVFATAFVIVARFVRRTPTIPRELSIDRALTARTPSNLIELSQAVDAQHWVFVVVALAVCLLLARRFRQALLLLLAEPLAEGLSLALKLAVNRQFPDQGPVFGWDRLNILLFPSGHVVRTTVTIGLFALFVAWPHARIRIPASLAALALIGLVGVTQVAVGGHLPLDVVGGLCVGATLVNLIYVLDGALARRGSTAVVAREQVSMAAPPAALGASLRRPTSTPRLGGRRGLVAAGLAIALVGATLSVHAPQRLVHLAAQPAAVGWPRSLVAVAGQRMSPARAWLAKMRGWVVST